MTRVTSRLKPTLGLIAVLALAACNSLPGNTPGATSGASSSAAASTTPSNPPTDAPTDPPTAAPTPAATATPSADPTQAVVKVEQVGGMLPPWETLRFYPSVALYADGKLITQGPQIEIYPGPALPNLQVVQLTEVGVQQVLDWAAEAGLTGPDRQLGEIGFDAGATLVSVTRPEGTHKTLVADMSASDAEVGAVAQFERILLDPMPYLADNIVGNQPYAFDRLRVISSEADPAVVVDPELSSTLEWPLDVPLSKLGTSLSEPAEYRCGSIEGDELAALLPLLQQANELTMWESEGTLYTVRLHPLLPDDEVCPGF